MQFPEFIFVNVTESRTPILLANTPRTRRYLQAFSVQFGFRVVGLPMVKKPERWTNGEQRALAAPGATNLAREGHAEPVSRACGRSGSKTQS